MKRKCCPGTVIWIILATVTSAALLPRAVFAQDRDEETTWVVPIVMEVATVRGKVVVLEDRRRSRQTLGDLPVEVWSVSEENGRKVKQSLLHETSTSDTGMFELPYLEEGEYRLVVSAIRLRLLVVPRSRTTTGEDPKILLIMVPKDVVEEEGSRAKREAD